jgi:hypothetical protein
MKIIGRIIIVLFLTAVLCTGIYFLFNGTQTQTATEGTHSNQSGSLPSGGSELGPKDGSGFHGGRNAEEVSSVQWLEVLQNMGIIGVAVVIVAVTRKVASIVKKRKVAIPPAV